MDSEETQLLACIPRLRRYARALVGDRGTADDLVQDTLEKGWKKLALWRRDSDMRAWLFGIMHNLHVDHVRGSRLPSVPFEEDAHDMAARATQADRLEVRDLEAALRLLPPEQREVLLMVTLEDMTYEEVAKVLCIPVGTVMSRLSRGREKLRAAMEGRVAATPLKVVK